MSQMQQSLAHRRWRRPRLLLALLGLLALGLAALGYWHFGKRQAVVPLPTIDLKEAEPEVARAVGRARERVRERPESPESWGSLGEVLLAHGYMQAALECLKQAERRGPQSPRWPYLQGLTTAQDDAGAALPAFERAAQLCDHAHLDAAHATAIRLRLAEALIEAGRWREARAPLQRVLETDPNNPRAHFNLGVAALAANDLPASRDHFLLAAESPYTAYKASVKLAAVYQRLDKEKQAAEYGRRAARLSRDRVALDPYFEEYTSLIVGKQAYFVVAEYLMREGHLHEAAQRFEKLLKEVPEDHRSYRNLGLILNQLGRHAEAETILRQGARLAPDDAETTYLLTVSLFHQAERLADQPEQRSEARRKMEEAAVFARRTLAQKPEDAFAHLYLGLCLKNLEQPKEALEALRTAVRYGPNATDPHLHLGKMLAEQKERKEALAELKLAAELASPGDSRPQEALKQLQGSREPGGQKTSPGDIKEPSRHR